MVELYTHLWKYAYQLCHFLFTYQSTPSKVSPAWHGFAKTPTKYCTKWWTYNHRKATHTNIAKQTKNKPFTISRGVPSSSAKKGLTMDVLSFDIETPFKNQLVGVSKKKKWTPQIIHFNRVSHYFHHPFWGTHIFGNTHIGEFAISLHLSGSLSDAPQLVFRQLCLHLTMGNERLQPEVVSTIRFRKALNTGTGVIHSFFLWIFTALKLDMLPAEPFWNVVVGDCV